MRRERYEVSFSISVPPEVGSSFVTVERPEINTLKIFIAFAETFPEEPDSIAVTGTSTSPPLDIVDGSSVENNIGGEYAVAPVDKIVP